MAKEKTGKVSGKGRDNQPSVSPFEQRFPTIARWISQEEGWVELGADHYSHSLVRALYGGGMVWEGTDDYDSLDEALRAMEAGITAWLAENRPEEPTKVKAQPARKSDRRAGKKAEGQTPSARSSRSRTGQPPSPTTTSRHGGEDQAKNTATSPVPRAIVEKVRRFAEIAEGLRRGERFEITRLTSLKSLCKDTDAARSFALFLAVQARQRAEEKKAPERVKGLMDRAILQMESYLDDPSQEKEERLHPLLREIEQEQDEYERVGWNTVRIVHSRELLVVEKALRSLLRADEAPTWLYHAARDYAERYNSRHGTGLIPESAPRMQEIADFWSEFYGLGPRGQDAGAGTR